MRGGRHVHVWVIVAAYAAAQWIALAHVATARHVRCADHGELVDAPLGDRATTGLETPPSTPRVDHHCVAALHAGAVARTSDPPSLATSAAIIAMPALADVRVVARAIHVLAFAPKTSPPC